MRRTDEKRARLGVQPTHLFHRDEEAKPAACVRLGAQMDDLVPCDGEEDAKLAASARVGALIHRQRRDRSPPKLDSESQDGAKPMVKEQAKPASPAPDRGPAASDKKEENKAEKKKEKQAEKKEEKQQAEKKAKQQAEEEARQQAEEESRQKAEEEARRRQEPASPATNRLPAASLAAGLHMRANPASMGGENRRRPGSSSSTAMGWQGRRACFGEKARQQAEQDGRMSRPDVGRRQRGVGAVATRRATILR